ncbi:MULTISPECIES: hormogonium polysaccharide secretion pseudopilin HpsB [unclassified Anabaena]|uniref:hormogonium polysaccharide secretion pseudopilin HpsB n=1 Tax=unclassified Anabaena TaxID=2619674 RepID=UPI0039C64DDC
MIKKCKLQQKKSSSSDSGFTIIESLLGIVVVAILLAAISPVLVMSTAIRVQARRIEKATQAASTFIDGVRTGSIKPPEANKIELDPATAAKPRTLEDNLMSLTQMPVPTNATNLYLFKKDGIICHASETGCTKNSDNPFEEFYIQARQIIVKDSTANDGYRLAIRVYRADVDFDKPLLASTKDTSGNTTKVMASAVTGGLGNQQLPAIERTVDIGNIGTSFQALCRRLGLAPDKNGNAQNCQ